MQRLREQGLKYREIAAILGCTTQYVASICCKTNPTYFTYIGKECVYPNLRNWMNENKVSRKKLLEKMGLAVHTSNYDRMLKYLNGYCFPRKDYIDRLIAATGLPYEILFEVETSEQ